LNIGNFFIHGNNKFAQTLSAFYYIRYACAGRLKLIPFFSFR